MNAQGFGKPVNNTVVDKLKIQIVKAVKNRGKNVVAFTTIKKKKKALSEAVNQLAPQYPELHFQVTEEDKEPLVLIFPHFKNEKTLSYTWVESSDISNKWLVMATVPGAWDYRCLSVWKEQQVAVEIADQIFPYLLNMPLADWINRRGSYRKMMNSLPPDDDSIVGIYNIETQEKIEFDPTIQEQLQSDLKQAIQVGNGEELMKKVKYFLEEH